MSDRSGGSMNAMARPPAMSAAKASPRINPVRCFLNRRFSQHCLYLSPLPQLHGSFRPIFKKTPFGPPGEPHSGRNRCQRGIGNDTPSLPFRRCGIACPAAREPSGEGASVNLGPRPSERKVDGRAQSGRDSAWPVMGTNLTGMTCSRLYPSWVRVMTSSSWYRDPTGMTILAPRRSCSRSGPGT